jgi:hypothetical protein
MNARYVVAAVLVFFCWNGVKFDMAWPPESTSEPTIAVPSEAQLAWAEPLKAVLPKMLPSDREYLSAFYDALGFVIYQDGSRSSPAVTSSDQFVQLHAGSLNLAIEKKNVGKYPGLDRAIDQVFLAACGAESVSLTKESRMTLVSACNTLAWAFRIHHE